MDARGGLILRDDVAILPIAEVEESTRAELDCGPGDFVVSQYLGRAGSTLVDAETAELLRSFQQPRTVAEAVIHFSLPRKRDPEAVLEAVLPLIERFFRRGLLIDADDAEARAASRQSFEGGDRIDGLTVVRPLQILDDCELYQVRHGAEFAALKLHRGGAGGPPDPPIATVGSLEHEAAVLERLSDEVAPRLLRIGTSEGRPYLLLEWCHGIDLLAAGAEWRRRSGSGARIQLLALCRHIARVYARLHGLGVLHGDVHPRNLLIDRQTSVQLVDFACASSAAMPLAGPLPHRAGVPIYFEPEHARAMLAGEPPVPVSEAGEQFAVGALLYHLVTGVHYCDFGLERRDLFQRIAEAQPVAFSERGLAPWPELEEVLHRALAKQPADRFPSMAAFADALDALPEPTDVEATSASTRVARYELKHASDDLLKAAELGGAWLSEGLDVAPTASPTHGAAGTAYALYRVACQRDDPSVLALADVWARRAESEMERPGGFYNRAKDLAAEDLGEISPFHTASGVFAVSAMIARGRNDLSSLGAAVDAFVAASEGPANGPDLTLGTSGTLWVCALLEDLRSGVEAIDFSKLSALGHRSLASLWRRLDGRPPMAEMSGEGFGIAHGWGGLLYATLQWCRAAGADRPENLERRLDELAAMAVPFGRGLRWLPRHGESASRLPSSWCQGSAGQVFLWTLAAHLLGDPAYNELAEGAAWDAWDGPELISSLCCGLAGRAYAMLRMHKHTGDRWWLDRARDLALRAARERRFESDYPHSLYKGELVLAVLAADLERPEDAAMPFFEEEGW